MSQSEKKTLNFNLKIPSDLPLYRQEKMKLDRAILNSATNHVQQLIYDGPYFFYSLENFDLHAIKEVLIFIYEPDTWPVPDKERKGMLFIQDICDNGLLPLIRKRKKLARKGKRINRKWELSGTYEDKFWTTIESGSENDLNVLYQDVKKLSSYIKSKIK